MGMLILMNSIFLMVTVETTLSLLLLLLVFVIILLLYRNQKLTRENNQYKSKQAGEQILDETVKERLFSIDILDNLPFPVFVKDINDDYKYLYWNKEAELRSGTRREEVLGHTDFDIYGAERGLKYRKVDEQLVRKGESYKAEEDYVTPDGVVHNTIVNKSIISHDKNRWLLIVRWDITQIKDYEKELIQAKEKLEDAADTQNLVLNSINFGLIYIDKEYKVQWESTSNLQGKAKERRYTPGKICYETVMGKKEPCAQCALSEAIVKGQAVRHEFSDGETTFEISAIPVFDHSETNILGGLMKIEDISDKKRIEHLMYEAQVWDFLSVL